MDRLNAIRLLQALVAAGANSDVPMANAWITKIALEIGLKGGEFHSAIAYAGRQDCSTTIRKSVGPLSPVWVKLLQELGLTLKVLDPQNTVFGNFLALKYARSRRFLKASRAARSAPDERG